MHEQISIAIPADIPALVKLVNSAYRGEEAKQGWTHEADLIDGSLHVDDESLEKMMLEEGSVILKYTQDEDIIGCVYLQKRGIKLYLGMLSVSPLAQAQGIGKKLLSAADRYALKNNCSKIEMTVISVRHELILWYRRNGYQETQVKMPFHNESRFGVPKQEIEFVVLEKNIR